MRVWLECDSNAMPMVQCKKCVHLPENRWCKKVNAECRPDEWHRCRFFKQKTNADRIRAMSDEELAKLFSDMACKLMCSYCKEFERIKTTNGDDKCNGECDKAYLEWLKEPSRRCV